MCRSQSLSLAGGGHQLFVSEFMMSVLKPSTASGDFSIADESDIGRRIPKGGTGLKHETIPSAWKAYLCSKFQSSTSTGYFVVKDVDCFYFSLSKGYIGLLSTDQGRSERASAVTTG